MSDTSSGPDPLDALAHEFAERFRRGERPSLSEYTDRNPELAEQIRELFPALVAMEEFDSDVRPGTGPFPAGARRVPRVLGDYRVVRELGRGGMGVVYEAVQESLGRHVALKVLPDRRSLAPDRLGRFLREAKAAAGLHHTNIVPVFGVGEHEGVHYYAMQFIEGQGLDAVLAEVKRLRRGTGPGLTVDTRAQDSIATDVAQGLLTGRFAEPGPPPVSDRRAAPGTDRLAVPDGAGADGAIASAASGATESTTSILGTTLAHYHRSVARLGVQVAEALAYAHAHGVLHRDIKPANLLLDMQGTAWVTDFGLAKAEGGDDLTIPGDIVGTLRYMAPERFRGQSDARSDVYGLGLTLYEMLTTEPAFAAPDRPRLIELVRHAEPERPRVLDPRIPRDLETIVLKAIDKDPARRYPIAAELADDLRRFLENRPIRARRVGAAGRAWRWAKRNPALGASIGALILVFFAAFAAVTALWWRSERLREVAQQQMTVARQQTAISTAKAADLQRQLYIKRVALAHREWEAGSVAAAIELLDQCPPESRGFEWNYCRRLCRLARVTYREHASATAHHATLAIAVSPDGARVATGAPDETVRVWDARTGRTHLTLRGHRISVRSVAYSPDGKLLASGGEEGTIRIWDAETGRLLRVLEGHVLPVLGVAFSPDGRRLASCTGRHLDPFNRREVELWLRDLSSRQVIRKFKLPGTSDGRQPPIYGVAFSPDGRRLVAASQYPRIFDVETGERLAVLRGHRPNIRSVAFSPDGQFVATGAEDNLVILWDARTGEPVRRLQGHAAKVAAVAFSPDGTLIASGGHDNMIRIWDVRTGAEVLTMRGHASGINGLGFSPDGRLVASAGFDGARVWDLEEASEVVSRSLGWHGGSVSRAAYSRDESLLATAGWGYVRIWDVDTGRLLRQIGLGPNTRDFGLAFGPDDRSIWVCNDGPPELMLVDVRTGRTRGHPVGHGGLIRHIATSRDGRLVGTASDDGSVRIFDATTVSLLQTLPGHDGGAVALAFSPGGPHVASIAHDGAIRIWDVRSGAVTLGGLRVVPYEGWVTPDPLAFSPDGRSLAAGSPDGIIRVWDVETGRESMVMRLTSQRVHAVAYLGPDGGRLVVAGDDSTIKLWDPKTGESVFTLRGHTNSVIGLACRRDGRQIVSTSHDQFVRLWDATPWPVSRANRDGLARVESLFGRGLPKDRVIMALRPDGSLTESERRSAIAIAERIGEAIEHESVSTELARHVLVLERLGRAQEAREVYRAIDDVASDLQQLRKAARSLRTIPSLGRDAWQPSPETLATLGRIGERIERRTDLGPADLYDLACFLALLHPLRNPGRIDSPDGEHPGGPSAELDAAGEAIRKAVEAGWSDADRAERDPDLAPLQGRDAFRRLIAALRDRAFPADPFAR